MIDRDKLRAEFEEVIWKEYFLRSIKFDEKK